MSIHRETRRKLFICISTQLSIQEAVKRERMPNEEDEDNFYGMNNDGKAQRVVVA